MIKLIAGFLIGFGSATSIIIFIAWEFLWRVLDSGYLIVREAEVIKAAEIATGFGAILGILLVAVGVCIELLTRQK